MSHSLQVHTPGKPTANHFSSKQDSNLHGETSLDFQSNALTTEPSLLPRGFPGGSDGKESTVQDNWVRSLVTKIPWRREWLCSPIFLPGKSHGQKNMADYSPWDRKESDTVEYVRAHTHNFGYICDYFPGINF